MTEKDIDKFEKVQAQLESLYAECTSLSKKSTSDALNRFKLKLTNQILSEANSLLKEKYKPFHDFNIFDEDDIPSNSDVALMLGQYLNCMEKLRTDNITCQFGTWYWYANNKPTSIETLAPRKLRK
jgi:hypothetical protein